jgi:phosphate-selective porin OprO/OprP
MKRLVLLLVSIAEIAAWCPTGSAAVVLDEDESRIDLGAAVQIRYQRPVAGEESGTDETSLRRLRATLAGTVTPNWWTMVDLDFGKAIGPEEVSVRDAYVQYRGLRDIQITLGNSKTPFSRKFLYSWKRIQSSDWGFVGDHNYGTPDRQLGLRVDARSTNGRWRLWAAGGAEDHDPDARFLDFDSPVNAADDWNEGGIAAVRLEMHPWGQADAGQGDFHTDRMRVGIGAAAFGWRSDADNAPYSAPGEEDPQRADLDRAEGVGLSLAVRGHGISADAEVQVVEARTVRSDFIGGIYRGGFGRLDKLGLLAGLMLPGNRVEAVAGWEGIDARAYEQAWTALEIGANIYLNRYAFRGQVIFRREWAIHGVDGEDASTLFVQVLQSF